MSTVVRSAFQVFTDGPVVVKIGATGFGIIAAAMYDVMTGLAFAICASFWVADLLLGMCRAIAGPKGVDNFDWVKFFSGFLKMAAASIGVGMAVLIDLAGQQWFEGIDGFLVATGAMMGLSTAFAISALKNFRFFFPQVADWMLGIITNRKVALPPADWYSAETQSKIQRLLDEDADVQAKQVGT